MVLADRRKVTSALFVRDVLCDRIVTVALASLLRFDGSSYDLNGVVVSNADW
jgi:hypothetical protein